MDYAINTALGDREQNEDAALGMVKRKNNTEIGCFVLADGLGGHGHGEVASQFVTGFVIDAFEEYETEDMFLEKTISEAQTGLLELQRERHAISEMKTTAVSLLVEENELYWIHVGDSRLYMFEKNKLVTRTIDHSVPQMLALCGEIKEKQIRKHPDRNKLMRVMGTEWEEDRFTVSEKYSRAEGQAFLLCSDGFWEYIDEKEMQKTLKKANSAEEWLNAMKQIVEKKGKNENMDNHTAIVIIL